MGVFDLAESLDRAEERMRSRTGGAAKSAAGGRRRRSDVNRSRLVEPLAEEIGRLLLGYERPAMKLLLDQIRSVCERSGWPMPARATVYRHMERVEGHSYRAESLPEPVRVTLYNLATDAVVPGHQLVFHCFNYGTLAALSFSSGLPWLDLYQAARMRGWRPKSLSLLRAVMKVRGI